MTGGSRRLPRSIAAARPPRASRVRAAVVSPAERVATIGPQSSLATWLSAAVGAYERSTPVVIDARRSARPDAALIDAVVDALHTTPPELVPAGPWVRLTDLPGATLDSVSVPRSVADAGVIIVSAPHEPNGVARVLLDVVHPNTAMRARLLPRGGGVELAAWVPAIWILGLPGASERLIAVTRNPLMAELIAMGVARIVEGSRGVEAITAWEEPGVQRLFELQIEAVDRPPILFAVDMVAHNELVHRLGESINAVVKSE